MRRAGVLQVAVALIGVAAGVISARLALSATWYSFGDTASPSALLGLAAGATLLTAGLGLLRGQPDKLVGLLISTAGIAWFATAWDHPYAPSWVFVVGRILGSAWPVLVAQGMLRMFGPAGPSERIVLVAAYAGTVGAGLIGTLFFDPARNGCGTCPTNPLLMIDAPGVAAWIEHAATLCGPFWAAALVAALSRRLVDTTAAQRRILLPITACALAILALVAAAYAHAIAGGLAQPAGTLVWTESVLLILLSLTLGWPALSLALARQRLARLVVQASAGPPVGGLGDVLGTALHDPTARLLYPHGRSAPPDLIDANGRPAPPRATLTPLTRGATTVAYLDHRAKLLEPHIAVISHVAGLSLDNERLHAERAAQLCELRASRVRIVAATDHERRRLERDLHDGAQQRLVSLALGLRLESMTPHTTSEPRRGAILADAEAEVSAALAELRSIARGLFPRELADEGLASALETFADTDPTPVELDLQLLERAPAAVESAAFFAVTQLLATSTYTAAPGRKICVRCQGGHLGLALQGGTHTDDLTRVEDRVGAVGGTVDRSTDGTIRIELPCGS